ncbi:MAG TPA: 6-carboxytetrahydropterin synthase [Bryobacteraceae bacterium]|nr:6-carboxytetrahydropterin synthase [Bryobacteraceae bacterium]
MASQPEFTEARLFSLVFRDYWKCAHSLKGEIFGPAQLMHVITFEVEVTYLTDVLDEYNLIVDFGAAQSSLQELLRPMEFKTLDDLPQFQGINTTTEYLCKYLHEKIATRVADVFKGTLRVTLRESAVAWCTYEGPVPAV